MTLSEVEQYLANNVNCFPSDAVEQLRELLLSAPDSVTPDIQNLKLSKPNLALMLAIFAGYLGIDQFYMGRWAWGIVKVMTCGGAGWLYLFGIILAQRTARNENLRSIIRIVS